MTRLRAALVPALVVALVVLELGELAAELRRPSPPRACAWAVLVDGVLHCDTDAPRSTAALCGDGHDEPIASGDAIDSARVCDGDPSGRARMTPDALAQLGITVDVNAADAAELSSLPGIGPVIAERVIAGRPYRSVDELERVKGIGPKTLARMRARVRVE